jgi:hydrogenase small subunit
LSSLFGEISRRDFMKFSAATAAIFGLSPTEFAEGASEVLAATTASKKLPVIWLEGQDCAGCTVSFAGALNPPIATLILDKLSVRYHETIMAGSGHVSEEAYHATVKAGGYVLVVEGSIPTAAEGHFCMVGGRPFKDIAVGVKEIVKDKPIINLSTCPVHVDHLVGTVLYYLVTGKVPPLDDLNRPLMYFGENIHDNCRRRSYFEAEEFLQDWNDPGQQNFCLYEKGCKGPDTFADCPVRRWNDGINFCIDCGAGCKGCAEPVFYAEMTPLYSADAAKSIDEIKKRVRYGTNTPSNNHSGREV